MEYGFLKGKVSSVSLVSNGEYYIVATELSVQLVTTNGHQLNFTGELTGKAEMVTDELSLVTRIISPLKYLIENNFNN